MPSVTVNVGSDIQDAINKASPGDIVTLAPGVHTRTSPLTMKKGVALKGIGPVDVTKLVPPVPLSLWTTKLVFTLGGNDAYAIVGADGVAITDIDIKSNRAVYKAPDRTTGWNFNHNAVEHHGYREPNGAEMYGILANFCSDFSISGNYFHDSLDTVRTIKTFQATNASFDYNRAFLINDLAHTDWVGNNVSHSYNYGRGVHRTFGEIQGDNVSTGLRVVGNVCYDYWKAYGWSCGVSVPPHFCKGALIKDNYFAATHFPGSDYDQSAHPDERNRFGYAIEAGGNDNKTNGDVIRVENNVLVGDWTCGVCASTKCVLVGNKKYGRQRGNSSWGDDYATEKGPPPDGSGWYVDGTGNKINSFAVGMNAGGNLIERDISKAPPPPLTSAPPPATKPVVKPVTVTSTKVTVNISGGTAPYKLERKPTKTNDAFKLLVAGYTGSDFTDPDTLNPSWEYTYRVTDAAGQTGECVVLTLVSDPVPPPAKPVVRVIAPAGVEVRVEQQ